MPGLRARNAEHVSKRAVSKALRMIQRQHACKTWHSQAAQRARALRLIPLGGEYFRTDGGDHPKSTRSVCVGNVALMAWEHASFPAATDDACARDPCPSPWDHGCAHAFVCLRESQLQMNVSANAATVRKRLRITVTEPCVWLLSARDSHR